MSSPASRETRGTLGPLIVDLEGDLSLRHGDRLRLVSPWIGGVILFARNFRDRPQLCALIEEIKRLRSPELLVTVDQEGGRVQRFQAPFTRLPPAAALGRRYDADPKNGERLAYYMGLIMAAELIECGVDLSFAPVLDVLSQDSRVIGDRAFAADPMVVERLAGSSLTGMHDAGMGGIGKHFPGHGGVGADSHVCLPQDQRSLPELSASDLLPYRSLGDRLQGVMLAHVLYNNIDPHVPGYSSFWIREVLRGGTNFSGAVFSDDLSMIGAGTASLAKRCQMALQAGCDLLPVCNNLKAVDAFLAEPRAEEEARDLTALIAGLYARPTSVDAELLATARESLAGLR